MTSKRKKILIFGGAGFLGGHAADYLALEGHHVITFDKMELQNKTQAIETMVGDILCYDTVLSAVDNADVIFNFAAIPDIDAIHVTPQQIAEVNIIGHLNIISACKLKKKKRYIFASSLYVSGNKGGWYGCTKRAAEDFLLQMDIPYTILRIGSAYGSRSSETNRIYRLVKEAIITGKISLASTPELSREYIHAIDIAKACGVCLNDKYKNKTLNLSGPERLNLEQLTAIIAELTGAKIEKLSTRVTVNETHYKMTPNHFNCSPVETYSPGTHIAIGEGLVELATYIERNIER